jgi:hypothetical protein
VSAIILLVRNADETGDGILPEGLSFLSGKLLEADVPSDGARSPTSVVE